MRILLISTLTGLLCGIWLYIATHPVSMTRIEWKYVEGSQ